MVVDAKRRGRAAVRVRARCGGAAARAASALQALEAAHRRGLEPQTLNFSDIAITQVDLVAGAPLPRGRGGPRRAERAHAHAADRPERAGHRFARRPWPAGRWRGGHPRRDLRPVQPVLDRRLVRRRLRGPDARSHRGLHRPGRRQRRAGRGAHRGAARARNDWHHAADREVGRRGPDPAASPARSSSAATTVSCSTS